MPPAASSMCAKKREPCNNGDYGIPGKRYGYPCIPHHPVSYGSGQDFSLQCIRDACPVPEPAMIKKVPGSSACHGPRACGCIIMSVSIVICIEHNSAMQHCFASL